MKAITSTNPIGSATGTPGSPRSLEKAPANSFGTMLKRSLNQANQIQLQADEAMQSLATGQKTDIHQTMIAVEKAEITFQLLMQVRNKIIAAYETIMRMQV